MSEARSSWASARSRPPRGRTRRRGCRCGRGAPPPPQRAPEQIGVREQEPEGDGGEGRKAAAVSLHGEDQRACGQRGHREPGPAGAEPESPCRGDEQGEEENIRWPEVRRTAPAREAKGDRDALEDARVVARDLPGRAEEDRPDVDPGNDRRDQRRPRDVLEKRQEPKAEQDEREELRQVEEDVEVGEPITKREPAQRRWPATVGAERDGQQKPDQPEPRRDEDQRDEEDVRPVGRPSTGGRRRRCTQRSPPSGPRVRVPGGGRLVGRQFLPPGAERLEGVPERRLCRRLVERGVDVRDDERLDGRGEHSSLL